MVDVLAIGSHPDDIEFGCGGILAGLSKQNKSIVLVDMTLGEKGTAGSPEERKVESEKAAALIGAERVFLDFKDCEIVDTYEGRLKLVEVFRKYKPKLILAPMWKGEQNHPDHLATGLMARYACRYARFKKILPELPIHRPDGILHYIYPCSDYSDFLIDVSPHFELWKAMMQCHDTQMKHLNYGEWNLRMAARLGMMIGVEYAQGLIKGNPIVVDDLMSISRGTREI